MLSEISNNFMIIMIFKMHNPQYLTFKKLSINAGNEKTKAIPNIKRL